MPDSALLKSAIHTPASMLEACGEGVSSGKGRAKSRREQASRPMACGGIDPRRLKTGSVNWPAGCSCQGDVIHRSFTLRMPTLYHHTAAQQAREVSSSLLCLWPVYGFTTEQHSRLIEIGGHHRCKR